MGRNLSPALRQELANLEKDPDSRKSAMKALKGYVKDMDSKSIPQFLAQVYETKDAGCSPGEYTISIYEVLARVHGPNIVPQLDNIMSSIIKTLTTSGGSFPLQQACSKVVPAIARYGIEPTTPKEKKMFIIHSLCKPLSDALLGTQESLSCGAALCLKALVDCDNWRFASADIVNEVCLKLAGALEDSRTQTNSHMGLVMSLAKHNSLVVEAYARLLIRAGLNILNCGVSEKNSQKRLTAIQMVHSLMKCLDIRSIFSELDSIIEEMEKCQSDQMPYVKGAAFEAMQSAKRLLVDKSSKISCDEVSVTGSNFSSGNSGRRSQSPLSVSPESHTLDSFAESFMDSPISMSQGSCNVNHVRKNINRKLWNPENGYVEVSLKDGIFPELARGGYRSYGSSEHGENSDSRSYANGFPGFTPGNVANGGFRSRPQSPVNGSLRSRPQSPANGAHRSRPQSPANRVFRNQSQSPVNGAMRSQTPSPQRTCSQINVDSIKLYTTPRKLVRSLQHDDDHSDYYDNQPRRNRIPCSAKSDWSPMFKFNQNDSCSNKLAPTHGTCNMTNGNEDVCCDFTSESISSTNDCLAMAKDYVSNKMIIIQDQSKSGKVTKKSSGKMISIFLSLFFLFISVVLASVLILSEQGETLSFVPT